MSEGVAVEALTLTLGAFRLKKISFAVSPGEILVVLGPNGAGKSVTLETIAGFHRPDSGRVLIGGREVTALPPERRKVGFVVQNFGLFPHLTVAQNVAIAKHARRASAAPARAFPPLGDPAALLAYFDVAHLAQRVPAALSPGEKQRVALARALARAPELFLFDEPFSALDAETRDLLRAELKAFLRALPIPAIFVTHDRSDAMMLADKILVLRDGAVVQTGATAEVFQRPTSSFVARFIGIENILSARAIELSENLLRIEIGERALRASVPEKSIPPGHAIFLSIRAEDVTICSRPTEGAPSARVNRLHGQVADLRPEGPLTTVVVDCRFPLKAYLLAPQARAMNLGRGSAVTAEIAADAIHVMLD